MPTESVSMVGGGWLIIGAGGGVLAFLCLLVLGQLLGSLTLFYGTLIYFSPLVLLLLVALAIGVVLASAELLTDTEMRTRRNVGVVVAGGAVLLAAAGYLALVMWSHDAF